MFTDIGLYGTGEPPPQLAAFNILADQPNAVELFDRVARKGTSAGKLFALCAFQFLDSSKYRRLVDMLVTDHSLVFTQFGCIGMNDPVTGVVAMIDEYSYGKQFREARDFVYSYFRGPAKICKAG